MRCAVGHHDTVEDHHLCFHTPHQGLVEKKALQHILVRLSRTQVQGRGDDIATHAGRSTPGIEQPLRQHTTQPSLPQLRHAHGRGPFSRPAEMQIFHETVHADFWNFTNTSISQSMNSAAVISKRQPPNARTRGDQRGRRQRSAVAKRA